MHCSITRSLQTVQLRNGMQVSSYTITFVQAAIMIVQSAPVNKRAIGVSLVDKTQQFYCTSEQFELYKYN